MIFFRIDWFDLLAVQRTHEPRRVFNVRERERSVCVCVCVEQGKTRAQEGSWAAWGERQWCGARTVMEQGGRKQDYAMT